jgi:hypothetical protein
MNSKETMTTLLETKTATLQDVIDYLQFELATFQHDPADTDFQLGYEQALRDLESELLFWNAPATCPACEANCASEFFGRPPLRWVH